MAGQAKAMTAALEDWPEQQQPVQASLQVIHRALKWHSPHTTCGSIGAVRLAQTRKTGFVQRQRSRKLVPGRKQMVGLAAGPESATIRIRQNCSI
jgi:hypothetical protein